MNGVLESAPGSVFLLNKLAAQSFFVLSEVSRAIAEGHARGCELKYTLSESEIHITIGPKAADPADTATEG